VGQFFKNPLGTGLFVLICVIDVGLHYFLFDFNRWLSFPHMLIGSVDMSITVCLSVCKFVTLYGYGFLRAMVPIFGKFAPPEAQNPTNRRPF